MFCIRSLAPPGDRWSPHQRPPTSADCIVLLETALANIKKQVFVLQFAVGEFDMVVFDPAAASCEIFEIKHSAEIVPEQTRHLRDEKKCADTASRFGTITGKYVIYRGTTQDVDGIRYVNVEEYLNAL